MILTDRQGGVMRVTLDRSERRNALGTELMRRLADALAAADADPDVGAVVLSGAPPAFCAGSDLKELGRLDVAGMGRHEAETAAVARAIGALGVPVVAAVEGYALGGGFILAISCDLVVTAADTRWHLPEVANGWLPPWGLGALAARTGPVRARMLVWGAEPIDGAEAHRIGVADAVTPKGEAVARAMEIAGRLAALPRAAVVSTKRFFEPLVAAEGERLDRDAGRRFVADCAGPAARATLERFTVKA